MRNLGPGRRRNAAVTLGALGLFLLFTHQNCAPSNPSALAQSSLDDSSPVTTIDDIKSTQALSFNYKQVEVSERSNEVVLQGACSKEQDGAVLAWRIDRVGGAAAEKFANGRANCEDGVFKVRLAPAQSLACGEKYKVSAQLGLGSPGEAELSRNCN